MSANAFASRPRPFRPGINPATGLVAGLIAQIEEAAEELARGHGVYKRRDDLLPGLRVRRAGHHYVFCLPDDDQPALILAILHERMDLIARLQERLD